MTCYWASPENYQHIAMQYSRLVSFSFNNPEEIAALEKAIGIAEQQGFSIEEYLKKLLKNIS